MYLYNTHIHIHVYQRCISELKTTSKRYAILAITTCVSEKLSAGRCIVAISALQIAPWRVPAHVFGICVWFRADI